MSSAVIDSSVILAVLQNEAIDDAAFEVVRRGVMSSVNLAEVYSKLAPLQMRFTSNLEALLDSMRRVEAFTPKQARSVGQMLPHTKHAGLSLGDRACLALALELGLPAYILDRNWLRVDVGCEIHCFDNPSRSSRLRTPRARRVE